MKYYTVSDLSMYETILGALSHNRKYKRQNAEVDRLFLGIPYPSSVEVYASYTSAAPSSLPVTIWRPSLDTETE